MKFLGGKGGKRLTRCDKKEKVSTFSKGGDAAKTAEKRMQKKINKKFQKGLAIGKRMWYNIECYGKTVHRGIAQLVEYRSPKPWVAGSNPPAPAKKFRELCSRNFFIQAAGLAYHHASACISSPKAYIITRSVYFRGLMIYKACALMIYNSFGIDDIQRLRR